MEDRIYDFWAASLQDGYIGELIAIVDRAGGARNLYNMEADVMAQRLGITGRMVKHICKRREDVDIERLYEEMLEDDISYIDHKDPEYPRRLREICSCPYGLFVKGCLPEENRPKVAIVGSRECSEYGRLMAEYYADRLARLGIDIISGMAWGIDGIAQMSAVKAGGKSYAILGCGVDIIYPRNNHILYNRLCDNGNGLISEYAPKTGAISRQFPPRNRIIAGMCDCLLVVEARAKSGTLITADMAIDQGKSVLAVPGRITDPLSIGCINLINQGAKIASSIESVLDELSVIYDRKECIQKESEVNVEMTDMEKRVLSSLDFEPRSPDFIASRLQIPVDEILVILTQLEAKGLILEKGICSFALNTTGSGYPLPLSEA